MPESSKPCVAKNPNEFQDLIMQYLTVNQNTDMCSKLHLWGMVPLVTFIQSNYKYIDNNRYFIEYMKTQIGKNIINNIIKRSDPNKSYHKNPPLPKPP